MGIKNATDRGKASEGKTRLVGYSRHHGPYHGEGAAPPAEGPARGLSPAICRRPNFLLLPHRHYPRSTLAAESRCLVHRKCADSHTSHRSACRMLGMDTRPGSGLHTAHRRPGISTLAAGEGEPPRQSPLRRWTTQLTGSHLPALLETQVRCVLRTGTVRGALGCAGTQRRPAAAG